MMSINIILGHCFRKLSSFEMTAETLFQDLEEQHETDCDAYHPSVSNFFNQW